MAETRRADMRVWLLSAVDDLGDNARRPQVHARVRELYGHLFTPDDLSPRSGRPAQEANWKNHLDSEYDRLKKLGLMQPSQQGDPWRLTNSGRSQVPRVAAPVDEASLLANFKPKSSSDYVAQIRGRCLLKTRTHESILESYGRAMAAAGWRPSTAVHPCDMQIQKNAVTCIVEVKMVYNGNATQAVRSALAQLLEYRHFLYDQTHPPSMLALFSEDVGCAHVEFLEIVGILSVWRHGSGWSGSKSSLSKGFFPVGPSSLKKTV